MNTTRVILIGGTSHAGKSTLVQALQQTLGWDCTATDRLARHPGRPWKTPHKAVPPHVADHYRSLSADELLADVLCHYQGLWPSISDTIRRHATDPSVPCLIMEGSALWPSYVATLDVAEVRSVWLTASDSFLQQRIYANSQFGQAAEQEKILIQQFLERTLRYNHRMMMEVHRLGLVSVNVEEVSSLRRLTDHCLSLFFQPPHR